MKLQDLGIASPKWAAANLLNEYYFQDQDQKNTAHERRTELSLGHINRLRKIKDRNTAEYKERMNLISAIYNQ